MSLAGDAHFSLAQGLHREGRLTEAIAAYRAALRIEPGAAEIHHGLARALLAANDLQQAVESFQRAFELDTAGTLDRRDCLDVFRFLQFQELPQFWYGDLERFFRRDDVDKFRYARAGLNALMAKPAFLAPGAATRDALMGDSLFRLLLQESLVADPRFELYLSGLRKDLLLDEDLRNRAPLEFIASLAQQCFINEFAYAESRAESDALASRARDVADAKALAVYAMYRPIGELPHAESLVQKYASGPAALAQLVQLAVANAIEERGLRDSIRVAGRITDSVSSEVRAQYEANPYPRWLSFNRAGAVPAPDWIRADAPGLDEQVALPERPSVLVAGCGTGAEAIAVATGIQEARVSAIDLSLASLAYAMRMARKLRVRNVEFIQADILELDVLEQAFDVIYCSGVLHHMREPAAGLRALRRRLKPGALMRIGLYTERGRSDVNAAQALIRERGIEATLPAIRAFRQEVLGCAKDSQLRGLLHSRDFYAMSECRDLLFHVQEHQFDLPRIAAMLAGEGLEVLGLSKHMPRSCALAYRRSFPGDVAMIDLHKWDAVERQYPDLFRSMVFVWCRAPTYNVA